MSDSCGPHEHSSVKRDYFFLVTLGGSVGLYFSHLIVAKWRLSEIFFDLFNTMSLGLFFGILFMGILGRVPREYIFSVVGAPGERGSLLRATAAGLLLDLCSHGILMVGMRLYQRGASIGQVVAFLIASPWNSISLTLILISLIGLSWTLVFILLSGVVALITGYIFEVLLRNQLIPENPNTTELRTDFKFIESFKKDIQKVSWHPRTLLEILKEGLLESRMILRWLLFGALLSSLIMRYVDTESFQQYFGPDLLGLGLTLVAATIIEVCSEGSTPIGADLVNRAGAPGNGFSFLMAGASTDYTEIMALKETTHSWKIPLLLPAISVPQIMLLGWILNHFQA